MFEYVGTFLMLLGLLSFSFMAVCLSLVVVGMCLPLFGITYIDDEWPPWLPDRDKRP